MKNPETRIEIRIKVNEDCDDTCIGPIHLSRAMWNVLAEFVNLLRTVLLQVWVKVNVLPLLVQLRANLLAALLWQGMALALDDVVAHYLTKRRQGERIARN